MTGTVKNSDQLKQALVLRAGGYSLAAIAQNTGISAATLSRHFSRHKVEKGGLTNEAVNDAKHQLLNDAGFISDLKRQIAASIVDDLSQVTALREAVSLTLEATMSDKELPAHYRARSLAALATTLTLTQKAVRIALQADLQPVDQEGLPNLYIEELTSEDIERLRKTEAEIEGWAASGKPEDSDEIIETTE